MAPPVRQRSSALVKKETKKPVLKKTPSRSEDVTYSLHPLDMEIVIPGSDTAFKALLTARFCAAIWSHISDCDEAYNYWEPTHYLLFGKGLQTWEYSPLYALRSYTYLMVHAVPAYIYHRMLQPNRMLIFYFTRCLLGLLCTCCEVFFYRSICREFGVHVARMALVFMVFSAGMFVATTAYLPSTFSMYMMLLALGGWYQRKYELSVFTTALSTFVSWPFTVVLGVPIAYDMVFRQREILKFIIWCALSVSTILFPMIIMDSHFYGRNVMTPLNILVYNVFTAHGPNLYGTEPWTYYYLNGFLNFNFVFVAALVTPTMLVLVHFLVPCKPRNADCLPYYLSIAPLYLWFLIFFTQAHKEERFLFPVYPMICVCGAISVDCVQKLWFCFMANDGERGTHYLKHTTPLMAVAITVCSLLGLSRIFAIYNGYHAPLDLFMELNHINQERKFPSEFQINVCMGKDWYRFPSSFFLPNNNWSLRFLRSEFRGQLPGVYSSQHNGTAVIPPNMNYLNREEPSRYVDVEQCHFLLDLNVGYSTEREPNYSEMTDKWTIIKSIPFLDTARSHRLFRAFYVPFVSFKFCNFLPFNLLQANKYKLGPKNRS